MQVSDEAVERSPVAVDRSSGDVLERIRLRPARANGQPGLAAYAQDDPSGSYRAYGLMVFAIDGDRVVGITGFPQRPDFFQRLGLRVEIPA